MSNQPVLLVQRLSTSFADVWPSLAREAGLTLDVLSPGAPPPDANRHLVILAAGGAEDLLVDAAHALRTTTDAPFVAVGAEADHRAAVSVLQAGASDVFILPPELALLQSWVLERADRLRMQDARRAFVDDEAGKYRFDGMLGSSSALREALARASRVIPHGAVTVLVAGETGTGKELLARAIHYNGPRRDHPFVDINCAALPEHLLESELFGHEKGAFTDATTAKPGLFEVAHGGTVFLDEIGHLALPLQAKLLRTLQERSIRRVGGTKTLPIDVRIIAATHVDLAAAVRSGAFREDLYYRLNVVPIALPALRERREDVPVLARHFLDRFAREYGLSQPSLAASAERHLRQRDWPGNIRELRNVMERAVLLSSTSRIEVEDVEREAHGRRTPEGEIPFPAPLDTIIAAVVARTLAASDGNKSEAARQLRISRARLQRLLDMESTGEPDDA